MAGGAVVLGTLPAQAAGLMKYRTYKVPTDSSQPRYITPGSDGNLWFTEGGQVFTPGPDPDAGGTFHSTIGMITPTGDITEYRVDCDCFLDDIEQGPGDILYFTTNDFGALGRITTQGVVDFITPQRADGTAADYILGGGIDGRGDDLWGSSAFRDVLWRYDVGTGELTEHPATDPGELAVAADGVVWFTAPGAIRSLDPVTGSTTEVLVTGTPAQIAVASDGKVWWTERFADVVGFLDPATGELSEFSTPGAGPQDIAAAGDGSMWFTQANIGNAARITADGVITEAGKAVGDDPDSGFENALGITVRRGPEGESVWFTMEAANKIAALTPR
ncbi:Vgb family protein [Georgenia muralis]